MKIGIAFDLLPLDRPVDGPDDRFEEFDKPETVEALADVLRGEGHEVVLLGDGRDFLIRVLDDPPDFVWNLAEGEGAGRSREARVPAALEMLGIPHTGSDPFTLAVSLDKDAAKQLARGGSVFVPEGRSLPADWGAERVAACLEQIKTSDNRGTLILKPAHEGSSKGIRAHSIARSRDEAVALYLQLANDYGQPVLVEEFIAGDEVTVGIVGNGELAEILGVMRVRPKQPDDHFIYSLEFKRDWDERIEYETPARLAPDVMARLSEAALAVYQRLACRDVARIDFRIRDGVPYFIEANPLPGLAPGWSDLVILARGMGIDYPELILRILDAALTRTKVAARPARGVPS